MSARAVRVRGRHVAVRDTMAPVTPTALGALELTQEEGRLVISERRSRALGRALLHTSLAAASLVVLIRLAYLAAASAALWALPAAGALVVLVLSLGRAGSAALDRESVQAVGDTLFSGSTRLRNHVILALYADDNGIRVVCVGGARQLSLFQGYPRQDLETAAQALRSALGVPAFSDEELPVLPQDAA